MSTRHLLAFWWRGAFDRENEPLYSLVEAVMRDPFSGMGKPEPLKYFVPGAWSRRLTDEHRIVYLVSHDRIDFLQARYHY